MTQHNHGILFEAAIQKALQYENPQHSKLPVPFFLLSFAILLTFCSLLVSQVIKNRFHDVSKVLEKIAISLAASAFFTTITSLLILSLKWSACSIVLPIARLMLSCVGKICIGVEQGFKIVIFLHVESDINDVQSYSSNKQYRNWGLREAEVLEFYYFFAGWSRSSCFLCPTIASNLSCTWWLSQPEFVQKMVAVFTRIWSDTS